MNYVIASLMFIIASMCVTRGVGRNETEPFTAAGLFCLAGCILIK